VIQARPTTPLASTSALTRQAPVRVLDEQERHESLFWPYAGARGQIIWFARCACGWHSPRRSRKESAEQDSLGHEAEMDEA
jgi:hypothetical protein